MWSASTARSPQQRPLTLGDYEVKGELGRGAMSVVYRATRDDRTYAIKMLATMPGIEASAARAQFRREAAAIARVRHPSLVHIVEVGEGEHGPFLVMDFADGETLEARIARGPLSDDETVCHAKAIADALVEVHRFGLVHRDIKPDNIIVSPAGVARLIDFGLVSESPDSDMIVGTPRYASPEQVGVLRRAVTATSDLYSLGATLFECVAGRPAFGGENPSDLLHQIAAEPAPDLRSERPGCRPALAVIVSKLLSKDPDDRYQSAAGLLTDLADLGRLDEECRTAGSAALGTRDAPVRSDRQVPLFGRAPELARFDHVMQRAASGELCFVQVEGESGSGKSRLVREGMELAASEGALVLIGRCQELETAPFGALRDAVDQHTLAVLRMPYAQREAATARLREAAGEWAALVRRLSPTLAQLFGDVTEIRTLEPDSEQQRYYGALASFLRNLGRPGSPLVLVLDDTQWLDEGSLHVLERMAASAESTCGLVLTTARSGAPGRARIADMLAPHIADRIELSPLDRDAVGALVRARLGGRPLAPQMVDKVMALTSGNPFGVEEYLRALIESGVIRPVADGWKVDANALDAVQLPSDVAELVLRRLSSLGEGTARIVGLAGILGMRFSIDLLTRASKLDAAKVEHGVELMVRAGLVEHVGADACAFVHARVREAAIERLAESDRRDFHQSVAEVLDGDATASSKDLYARARHFEQGYPERNPRRVAEVCLAAGQQALRHHANDDAFELLNRALEMAELAGVNAEMALPIREGLGRACALTGRLDVAFGHLEEGLKHAHDRNERFRLKHLLTLTYASQGRNDDALRTLNHAFRVLGRPLPRRSVTQLVATLTMWVFALALRWTGIGYGRAKGEEREQRKVLSQLHYAGSMIALFQGRPFLMLQFIVRDFYNVHFLGETAETAIASSVYGAVLGTFQLKPVMQHHTRLGVEMAERLADSSALSVCRAYEAMGTKWSGELTRGNAILVETLPDLHRHVPGSWYGAMMICEQAYSYLHAGRSASAIEHVRANAPWLERTNNLMFRYNTRSVLYAELMVCGEVEAATALWRQLEAEYAPLAATIYVRLARCIASLEVLIDQEETGPEVDAVIAEFQDLVSEDYYSNAAWMLSGYARMVQFQRAKDEGRAAARAHLERIIRSCSFRALVPVFRCHLFVWRAVLARDDGRYGRARQLLAQAARLATRCQSRRGLFYVAVERARVARAAGDTACGAFANEALDVAVTERWRNKAASVRAEFSISEEPSGRRGSANYGTALSGSRSVGQAQRYADALLRVSLASASTLDGDALARNALNELARVLGSERALLFLIDAATGELALKASAGAAVELISRTVVRKVLDTRAPIILTGTDSGEAIGSQSIMTYGLRSIMAAPLMLRDRLIGVVYLDSRLAKGMFTEDDLSLLRGVANHIAIAVETANAARLEAERSALQRDLELVGAVQNLLLPRSPVFQADGLRGAGFYHPASQSGGDWWWHEVDDDGSVLLLLGDVSGHGAASAMVTSSVAGTFHTIRSTRRDADPGEILRELDVRVRGFGGGFHMTMTIVRIDPAREELKVWNAAGPPVFIERAGGSACVSVAGNLLGEPKTLQIGEATVPFLAGDRLLMCTDGMLELRRTNGRHLGAKRVQQLLARAASERFEDVPALLAREIDAILVGHAQDDDITFIVVEATPRSHATGRA